MKKILIVLVLVGLVKISTGSNMFVPPGELNKGLTSKIESQVIVPEFSELDGNLFVAINSKEPLIIEDGDVVEFEFAKNMKLSTFHINDVNQNLIDTGEADLFVLVHRELALKLKSSRVEKIHINHKGAVQTLEVNRYWIPDEYLDS